MFAKSVLITGCSSGIGRALSLELNKRGLRVIATARRLDSLQDLKAKGVHCEQLDVTDADQIQRLAEITKETYGGLDILINNAGYGLIAPMIEVSVRDLEQQFRTNTFAPLEIVRAFAPQIKTKGKGLIVNIGSVSGVLTTPFSGAYCASKAALHAVSDALRMELAPFGIRVVTVQPGGIQSAFGQKAGQLVKQVLKQNSWYQPIRSFIEQRANASQEKAMPADLFARKLCDKILSLNPPAVIRLGEKSRLMPFLKWALPMSALDNVLSKKFGLKKLAEIIRNES